ncbi:MAG: triose-phosphate isomerase [Balneolaceae bacterium]
MRRLLIAGNWKMNLGPADTYRILEQLSSRSLDNLSQTDVLVTPPYVSLPAASEFLGKTPVQIGGQNVHHAESGAYTGEISASMLTELGCSHVLVGHSERRAYFRETDLLARKKTEQAVQSGLHVILCVGENLEQRQAGNHHIVVMQQVRSVLAQLPECTPANLSIAYEPIWAVGTGETATPEQAQQMHQLIRKLVSDLWNQEDAEKLTIIYGGSMKPENASALLHEPDVDGGLIGGASLHAGIFYELIKIAETVKK